MGKKYLGRSIQNRSRYHVFVPDVVYFTGFVVMGELRSGGLLVLCTGMGVRMGFGS